MNLEPAPRISKTTFLIIDGVLVLTAFVIIYFAQDPYAPLPFISAVLCVALASIIGLIPFLIDYAADSAEYVQQEREKVAEQVQRLHSAGESLMRAAAQIKAVEEAASKTAHAAETLPYRMQEKLAELNQQLAQTDDEEKERLSEELAQLRQSESERLQTLVEKIQKAAAEWSELEQASRARLSAAQETATTHLDAKISTVMSALDAKLATFAAVVASANPPVAPAARPTSETKIKATKASEPVPQQTARTETAAPIEEPPAPAQVETPAAVASEPAEPAAAPATPAAPPTPEPVVESKPAAPEAVTETNAPTEPPADVPVSAEPESLPASSEAEPATAPVETSETEEAAVVPEPEPAITAAPAEGPRPKKHRASRKAKTEEPAPAPTPTPEPSPEPAAVPASESTEAPASEPIGEVTPEPVAETTEDVSAETEIETEGDRAAADSDEESSAPVPPDDFFSDEPVQPRLATAARAAAPIGRTGELFDEIPTKVESSVSSDGATRLLATAYIGIGNKLYIRGDGPGLSWEKGVPMQFVSIGKWGWASHDATTPIRAKLYKNDDLAALSGEITLPPGKHSEVTALF